MSKIAKNTTADCSVCGTAVSLKCPVWDYFMISEYSKSKRCPSCISAIFDKEWLMRFPKSYGVADTVCPRCPQYVKCSTLEAQ